MAESRTVSFRLDRETAGALRALESSGLGRSEAIRQALVEAAQRRRAPDALAEEVRRVAADEEDRREKARIAEELDEISEPW